MGKAAVVLMIAFLLATVVGIGLVRLWSRPWHLAPTPPRYPASPLPATATPTATVLATPTASTPASAPGPTSFLAVLQGLAVPERDLADLARRLKSAYPTPTVSVPRLGQTAGHRETFWVTDGDGITHQRVTAVLFYVTDHLYMYVQDGVAVTPQSVRSSADFFERQTYHTNRRYFGTAWRPGLDGDSRITVLNTRQLRATGFYSAADEESPLGNPYSNGRHMVYMNLDHVKPGTPEYDAVLAHEFQHALHYFQDRNEDAWVTEGASVLAEKLNGFENNSFLFAFRRFGGTQLTTWSDEPDRGAHYGAAFSFMVYFYERFGEAALRSLIGEKANGADGFDRALASLGRPERFADIFADWIVANLLDNPSLADGRYGYRDLDFQLSPSTLRSLPATESVSARQFAATYIAFAPPQPAATVYFTGTTTVRLIATDPHSGNYCWWSNRGDLMNTSLTRSFDLTGVCSATLSFWAWYDLEKAWDYAYIEVSSDGGETWTTLRTDDTTTENPFGNNLGHGLTGKSGKETSATWVQQTADLSPYAGRVIQLRFEYVTDDAVNAPGLCVDDIQIRELGFSDDAENEHGWRAEGFVRSSNVIPQSFVVRLVRFDDETTVTDVPVGSDGCGQLHVSAGRRAVLVVAPTAPITTESARFEYSIVPTSTGG